MGFRFSLLADTQDKTTFLHLVFYDGYVGQLFGFGISCTSLKKETLHSETSLNKTFWYILRPTQQLSDYLFINNISHHTRINHFETLFHRFVLKVLAVGFVTLDFI